jgi:murein DD-endopeptidase MepM/ murein hydrolase activator NlpD
MKSPRYTVLIANGSTGAMRRFTLSKRAAITALLGVVTLPLLIGLGASNVNPVEFEALRQSNESLRLENESYRAATGELADQIASLQGALTQLGEQAELDPTAREALSRLPAVIRSRAMGGGAAARVPRMVASSPDSTFGMLKSLLGAVEGRLESLKTTVERQQALARSVPSIWPLAGWLSSTYGRRPDPFDGSTDFHQGLDIAADRGTPVRATADGRVDSAGYSGNYGNQVLVDHGFGIGTRFGHLSKVAVRAGQSVRRGEIVGYVGATGRATSPHLHYEILLNGQPINPLRLLARP